MGYEILATSDYLRTQHVSLIKVDLSDYLIDYYQHRKETAPDTTRELDGKLKDLISCFAIHLTNRIAHETHGWTVNIVSEKPYSLFVTGNTGEVDEQGVEKGFIVGNILTENIRHSDTHAIHAQLTAGGKTFNSYVPSDTCDISKMIEKFYSQSEQRPIRIKISETSDTAIALVAQPGSDIDWFDKADIEAVVKDPSPFNPNRMRTCRYAFKCDCSPEKLLPFFKSLTKEAVQELYGEDDKLLITCPRCGKQFSIERELV